MRIAPENAPEGLNCVLLLGAGASVPADYPATSDLEQRFRTTLQNEREKRFGIVNEDLWDRYQLIEERTPHVETFDDVVRALRSIVAMSGDARPVRQFAKETTQNVIDGLDGAIKLLHREIDLEAESQTVENALLLLEKQASKIERLPAEFPEFTEECETLLRLLMDEIYQQYRWQSGDDLNNGYEELMPYVRLVRNLNGDSIPIFTTNYDPSVESLSNLTLAGAPIEVNTLFSVDRDRERTWEGQSAFESGPNIVNLFKLHGSVTWRWRNDDIISLSSTASSRSAPEKAEREIIPPGASVPGGLIRDPYRTYFGYLDVCLEQADTCIVLGHQLKDPELIRYLREHSPRIVIVDHSSPEEIAERISKYDGIDRVDTVTGDIGLQSTANDLKDEIGLVV